MALTSESFLLFLAALLAAYAVAPKPYRWTVLLAGSLIFYAFSGFLLYLAATALSTYLFGLWLARKRSRAVTALWLVLHLGLLAAVKIPITGLLMPLGISFYTFQSAGYILDVNRRKTQAERNPAKLALFVCFFPQLIQGPISRHSELSQELFTPRSLSALHLSAGAQRILWGFFKKLVIADRLVPAVKLMSGETELYSGVYFWVNIVLYAVVLYADFTGGIDITIGAARLFGIKLTENFDRPFYARDAAEYWRRWHITMGTWFRDYLYYPLLTAKPTRRLSKKSRNRFGNGFGKRLPVYIVTLITWFATGVWHGLSPNFMVWGLANGFVIILSQELHPLYEAFHKKFPTLANRKPYICFAIVRTFLLMSMIRSLDIYGSVVLTFKVFLTGLMPWTTPGLVGIGVAPADLLVAGAAVALLIAAGRETPRRWYQKAPAAAKLSLCLLLLMVILVFGVYGYGYDANQFIYNQF